MQLSYRTNQRRFKLKGNVSPQVYFPAALLSWPSTSQLLSLCWHSARGREGIGTTFEQDWNARQTMVLVKTDLEPLPVKIMTLKNRKSHCNSAWLHKLNSAGFNHYAPKLFWKAKINPLKHKVLDGWMTRKGEGCDNGRGISINFLKIILKNMPDQSIMLWASESHLVRQCLELTFTSYFYFYRPAGNLLALFHFPFKKAFSSIADVQFFSMYVL